MIFACNPVSAVWTSWDGETKYNYCINQNLFYYVAAGVNIAIDIAIVAIPLPELWKLKMSTKKKLLLLSMFCVGLV